MEYQVSTPFEIYIHRLNKIQYPESNQTFYASETCSEVGSMGCAGSSLDEAVGDLLSQCGWKQKGDKS